jgi:2-oxoglutarate/2-oxoacid ferredoxin oxidoreductase subunit beta
VEPPERIMCAKITRARCRAGAPVAAIMRRSTPSATLLRQATAAGANRVVSGIGCSSRFPHYMKTYGFHGLHGRAFPVACGVKSRRPDLHVFVVTGDGDCCAIGAGHWIHALRYNMDLTVILLDNNVYGLTKNQTSPTTRLGEHTNTHPHGAVIPPLNPLTVALGITNASFVAQTVDWNPGHVYNTIAPPTSIAARRSCAILQRCPHFSAHVFDAPREDPSLLLLMEHEQGSPARVRTS